MEARVRIGVELAREVAAVKFNRIGDWAEVSECGLGASYKDGCARCHSVYWSASEKTR